MPEIDIYLDGDCCPQCGMRTRFADLTADHYCATCGWVEGRGAGEVEPMSRWDWWDCGFATGLMFGFAIALAWGVLR